MEVIGGRLKSNALVDHMPGTSRPWNDFTGDIAGRTVSPNDHLVLIELTRYEGEIVFEEARDEVRLALCPLSLSMDCTKIYSWRVIWRTQIQA